MKTPEDAADYENFAAPSDVPIERVCHLGFSCSSHIFERHLLNDTSAISRFRFLQHEFRDFLKSSQCKRVTKSIKRLAQNTLFAFAYL